jgi:hypothetical protein
MTNLNRASALCAGVAICAAGFWFALREPTGPTGDVAAAAGERIPNFAPNDRVSWYPDRLDGDQWLPPEPGETGPIMSRPDHPYIPNDASDQPTYRIADLSNPILQPWVRAQMERDNNEVLAGKIPFMARERCYPPGPAAWNVFRRVTPPMVFFVQQPTFVLLAYRGDNQIRHVYLNVPHSPDPKPSWNGESVGHYENGDTLVVDTIGILAHPLSFVDNYRTPHTGQLHVVERYRLSADGKEIDVTVQVEDPGAFTMPYTARQHYALSEEGPIEEAICAEGAGRGTDVFNWGLSHAKDLVPMPQDDTPDF